MGMAPTHQRAPTHGSRMVTEWRSEACTRPAGPAAAMRMCRLLGQLSGSAGCWVMGERACARRPEVIYQMCNVV